MLVVMLFTGCFPAKKFIEPNFTFPILEQGNVGESFQIDSLSPQVRYLVVNFFAPECPPCIDELPDISRLYLATREQRKDIRLLVLGSTLDAVDPQANKEVNHVSPDLEQFRKEHALKYPVYIADTKTLRSFGIKGFPETFVFTRDKENKLSLKRKFISSVRFEELEEYLSPRGGDF